MLGNGFFIFRKMTNEIEIWKDVVGYEGLYEVSSLGNVKSIDRQVGHKGGGTYLIRGAIKSQYLHKGYPMVSLYKNGIGKNWNVHRVVAFAFIPNPLNKRDINHIDGIKTNASITNLEWCTASENSYHAHHMGLNVAPVRIGSAHGRAKLTEEKVLEIRKLHSEGMKHKDLKEKFGIGKSPLCRIIARTAWSHI